MVIDLLLTVFLVLLNGFFVAAEFAIVKVRSSQVELKARAGNKMAKIAQDMLLHLDSYLSATQLGITLASLGLGWIGESVVTRLILNTVTLMGVQLSESTAHQIALPLAFALITILHIVFGELAPKSLAIQRAESTVLAVAIPLKFFYYLFKPFIWLLNGFANAMLSAIGISPVKGHEVHSPEELRLLLEQGGTSGAIETDEHQLIRNVFEFTDRVARNVMVPRTQVIAVEVSAPLELVLQKLTDEGYSRMPVYRETIDNIIGLVHAKDLLRVVIQGKKLKLRDILHPVHFIPETQKINTLLKDFQLRHIMMAVVLDEFGGTAGIITLEDILEELVGEIQDEYDQETPLVEKVGENEYVINTSLAISDVNEYLPHELPESGDYDTVGGLVNQIFGKIPDVDDQATFGHYEFTILKRNNRRVESVKLSALNALNGNAAES